MKVFLIDSARWKQIFRCLVRSMLLIYPPFEKHKYELTHIFAKLPSSPQKLLILLRGEIYILNVNVSRRGEKFTYTWSEIYVKPSIWRYYWLVRFLNISGGHLNSEEHAMLYFHLMKVRQLKELSLTAGFFLTLWVHRFLFFLEKYFLRSPVSMPQHSGNHAAALSLAAKLRDIPAYVIVPKTAPKCKVENVNRYGGQVIWSEDSIKSREDTATKVQQETGATLIHPFNDGRIIRFALLYFHFFLFFSLLMAYSFFFLSVGRVLSHWSSWSWCHKLTLS